ncbi:Anthranilate synthase component 1 [Corynebacterium capitovis DSM 44611]|uniref:aminodeoxychorismate synthase component I n=1 Tax=Corynebacterium capitovis TaxID=131081 RepID=UPI000376F1FE|nr:aminodeoxychorismate synthase component I [Corynebacterium capitovis]WKD57417.1 Anthranilate synthase component 1 [Corynebacterium capitovis DSM 44611]
MILLIDNRDSYTYNLAHLIHAAAGEEPLVVRADDVEKYDLARRVEGGEFSHIVISPGPGTPADDGDFRGSRLIIQAAGETPVLGVCLGHQGLAHLAGASVQRGAPHHGATSTITHSGEGIFAGLPQGFTAVRYHSLTVSEAPGVRVHARAEDGTVQGLEVVGRPHWGVQFHPESVLTDCGVELLRNFLSLSQLRVEYQCVDVDLDTESTFRALAGESAEAFWLDSATGEGFSILGTDRGSLTRSHTFRLGEDDILDTLGAELAVRVDTSPLPDLPFTGGWVGYLGYECATLTLPRLTPSAPSAYPDAWWVRPQSFIVYDHSAQRAHLMVLYRGAPDEETRCLMGELVAATSARASEGEIGVGVEKGSWRLSREDYLARIGRIKEALASGDSYEVCLTDTWSARTSSAGIDLYSRLRRFNPAPYAAYFRIESVEVLSSSPERFLTVHGRDVETKPIKGTIPREEDPSALRTDAKTRAENLMIVDLLRNDLGRVCEPGTVTVPKLMHVETYATVHQLVSTVRGVLRPGTTLIDLLRAAFPGGSMTGAPKERTCAMISELEPGARGVYSGVAGYLGFNGRADLSILIRTAVKQGDTVEVGAGGAVVWASHPAAEYEEKELKARAVTAAWQ